MKFCSINLLSNHSLVDNIKYSRVANDDDDARNDERDDEKSCFATSAVDIGQNGTSFQFRIVTEFA